jgi:hypothetical protein
MQAKVDSLFRCYGKLVSNDRAVGIVTTFDSSDVDSRMSDGSYFGFR